jgi:hypothetical protein
VTLVIIRMVAMVQLQVGIDAKLVLHNGEGRAAVSCSQLASVCLSRALLQVLHSKGPRWLAVYWAVPALLAISTSSMPSFSVTTHLPLEVSLDECGSSGISQGDMDSLACGCHCQARARERRVLHLRVPGAANEHTVIPPNMEVDRLNMSPAC